MTLLAPPRPGAAPAQTPALPPFIWQAPATSFFAAELQPAAATPGPPAQQARALLRAAQQAGHLHPRVVGALPFDPTQPATLYVAPQVTPGYPDWAAKPVPSASVRRVSARPGPAHFEALVAQAVSTIRAGGLHKVVLSRLLELELREPLALAPVLGRLAARHPGGYTFALPLDPAGERTLIGASPELLVRKAGPHLCLHPLAGTRPRQAGPDADAAQAAELLASAKDQEEHALMVEAIRATLAPLCRELHLPPRPQLVQTPTLWHLGTPIQAQLRDPGLSVLDVAQALHPTPAVCGVPQRAARQFLAAHEPFARGLFAGAVGWCDAAGDGEWAVTIRCAEVGPEQVRLFAGAGVVAASDPAQERAETAAKFRTMLQALGLDSLGTAL
ncbi:isochorismate synthase [Deinococcus aquaedulcis]|uniref:isochorismate synthase n=1 Tax=Deinococcus aquaedulcis TaxID=2840455 RepID=UPI001C834727|nr:isochorismate synthase [Deinococcus aquaedulcis]